MKIGRNDPCPCGSGKKYKKCCLPKDQQARHRRASRSEAEAEPQPPPDPRIEAVNARWNEFEAQDYEGQTALFRKTLDEPELMDGEMAIEMLSILYPQSIERGERDHFDALVEELRERLPDVYAQSTPYLLEWRITNALVTDQSDAVVTQARELARTADQDIDIFNNVLDMLAYHDQLSVLVEAVRLAWPSVEASADIVPWGIEEFAERAADYLVFDQLERHASLDPRDPKFLERVRVYVEVDPERLAQYLAHLTGGGERRWTMSDFAFQPRRDPSWDELDEFDEWDELADEEADEADHTHTFSHSHSQASDPGRQNLYLLTVEFLGYLRREEGVPYTKGELARQQISRYILDRYDGELEPRESPFEALMHPRRRKWKPKPKSRRPDHPLCPDHSTLDRYLGRLLHFLNPQRYKATATFELVPAWLRFLESRWLIDTQRREKTLQGLQGLDSDLRKVWEHYPDDPAPLQELERWPGKRA
ncbi:MAG: SEC-C metal-binding domain-containing protein [Candidatus Bipolaricaulia bacterium]